MSDVLSPREAAEITGVDVVAVVDLEGRRLMTPDEATRWRAIRIDGRLLDAGCRAADLMGRTAGELLAGALPPCAPVR